VIMRVASPVRVLGQRGRMGYIVEARKWQAMVIVVRGEKMGVNLEAWRGWENGKSPR